jgi:hypothetical protein
MSLTNKVIAGTVLGAGAIAAIVYVKNIKRAQEQLQIVPNASIYKLGLEGLIIKVDALLKNPTGASFKLKYPFIKLTHKNVLVGSSQVINKYIKIPAYGQVLIQDMMVKIPVLSVFSAVYDMAMSLMNNQSIVFTIAIITTVDLGWTQVAYEHKQDLRIKK